MKTLIKILFAAIAMSMLLSGNASAGKHRPKGPHAVTVWWVIFNEPDQCYGNADPEANCTALDVFGPAYLASLANGAPDPSLIAPNLLAKPAMIYATGGQTNKNGRIRLTASIYTSPEDQALTLPPGVDPLGLGTALESTDAEIHLVVRDHGRVRRQGLIEQITNLVDSYCSDPNIGYYAGRNRCHDEQFAVFGSGESGEDALYRFDAPGIPMERWSAVLLRDGNTIRAVIETKIDRSNALIQ